MTVNYNCEVCGSGPLVDGVTVYRANKPGEVPSRWRCEKHLERQVDAKTKAALEALSDE